MKGSLSYPQVTIKENKMGHLHVSIGRVDKHLNSEGYVQNEEDIKAIKELLYEGQLKRLEQGYDISTFRIPPEMYKTT